MGAFPKPSTSTFDRLHRKSVSRFTPDGPILPPQTGHPNPDVYNLRRSYEINGNLVVWIHYEGCTNYEGNKILVFEACTIELLIDQSRIDPHFSDNKEYFSPIARFEPTERGWQWAIEWAGFI